MDPTTFVPTDVGLLSLTAISIAFFHTVLGPDHYVPFVAMAQVGKWSMRKTIVITLLCGCGHVGSSIVVGLIGVALGIIVMQLEAIESVRGDLAGWLLLFFGLAYFLWGLYLAWANKPHRHLLVGVQGLETRTHQHPVLRESLPTAPDAGLAHHAPAELASMTLGPREGEAGGAAPAPEKKVAAMTPWVLAVIFILGPCEPLIPLLMYPAARANSWALACVTALFALVTLLTMTTIVVLMKLGARVTRLDVFHQYGHALAGFAILVSGLAIKLGL